MAVDSQTHRLLYNVARSYYVDGLTQERIASRLGISRSQVSRLLAQARARHVVDIVLHPPPSDAEYLARRLEERFALQEATAVAMSGRTSDSVAERELAAEAAALLLRRLHGHEVIAVAGGSAILDVARALPGRAFPSLSVAQMVGSWPSLFGPADPADMTRDLAGRLGSRLSLLHAPAIVATPRLAEDLQQDAQIAGEDNVSCSGVKARG